MLLGKRRKEPKIKGMPIKPIPPYIRYYREIKDELKSKNPGF